MKKRILIKIIVLLATLSMGCSLLEKTEKVESLVGNVALIIDSPFSSRTIYPIGLDLGVASYNISGTGPNSETITKIATGTSVVLTGLVVGEWTFTVSVKNSSDVTIGTGTSTCTVKEGEANNLSVTVEQLAGTGILSLTVNWSADKIDSPVLTGVLTNTKTSTSQTLAFTINSETGTYSTPSLEAGVYDLTLSLKSGEFICWDTFETVVIFKGETSSKTFTITDNDLNVYNVANYVRFNMGSAEGGGVPTISDMLLPDDTYTLPDNTETLIKEGHNFTGWNTKADGTGTHYNVGASVTITYNRLDLYSEWETLSYDMVFNFNGADTGVVPGLDKAYLYGTEIILSQDLTKTGLMFKGWNTALDGTGTMYTDTYTVGAADTTLYAYFREEHRITYNSNGGTTGVVPDPSEYVIVGNTITLLGNIGALNKDTFGFFKWNTQADGNGTDYTAGDTITIANTDITLYAKYQQGYKITYYSNEADSGNTPSTTIYYVEGTDVTVSENIGNLAKTGYVFVGWNTNADGSGTSYAVGDTLTIGFEDVDLYAKWKVPIIGDIGPSGGYIFYDKGSYSDGWRYLEAAPADISGTKVWGTYSLSGADGTAIGTGKQNTLDIIAGNSSTTNAAHACADYSVTNNGVTYSDWFLPSKAELGEMYSKLKVNGLGGFTTNYYWSSSEYSTYDARMQYFGSGYVNHDYKNYDTHYVRAVRAF